MITFTIEQIFYNLLVWLTSKLPDVPPLQSEVQASLASLSPYFATINQVVPITTLLSVLALFLVIEAAILGYKAVMWVVRKIPGIS